MRRGVDFAEAEAAIKIRGKYLRALEDDQFELLPAETYVKGFLRTYAEYLGLDGQLYVDEFNSRFVAGEDHDVRRARARRSTARPQRRNRRAETTVVLFALAAIAVFTVIVISAWTTSDKNPGAVTHPKTSRSTCDAGVVQRQAAPRLDPRHRTVGVGDRRDQVRRHGAGRATALSRSAASNSGSRSTRRRTCGSRFAASRFTCPG